MSHISSGLFNQQPNRSSHPKKMIEASQKMITIGTQGPAHSNGMCLLDLPFHSHLKPIASTSLAKALPHVATVPGPVSLPGGLSVCTLLPGGVMSPVNASAL